MHSNHKKVLVSKPLTDDSTRIFNRWSVAGRNRQIGKVWLMRQQKRIVRDFPWRDCAKRTSCGWKQQKRRDVCFVERYRARLQKSVIRKGSFVTNDSGEFLMFELLKLMQNASLQILIFNDRVLRDIFVLLAMLKANFFTLETKFRNIWLPVP